MDGLINCLRQPGQLYCDMTNPAHLSGLRHLDSFIVTPNARPSIGTLQKQIQPRRRRQLIKPPGSYA